MRKIDETVLKTGETSNNTFVCSNLADSDVIHVETPQQVTRLSDQLDDDEIYIVCASQTDARQFLERGYHKISNENEQLELAAETDANYIYLKQTHSFFHGREVSENYKHTYSTSDDESLTNISGSVESVVEHPEGKNTSIITIFSMWSTMMGTSILTMPWALEQAGFGLGVFLLAAVALIMAYLAYRILRSSKELALATNHPTPWILDFSKVCSYYLGRPGKLLCLFSSILSLAGALIVYYVLLVNFAYNIGSFIHDYTVVNKTIQIDNNMSQNTSFNVICRKIDLTTAPLDQSSSSSFDARKEVINHEDYLFQLLWNPIRTVPVWLLFIMFPLISIRSPTFFTKFTALGTVAIVYILALTFTKAGIWGFNANFSAIDPIYEIPLAKRTFPALTGVGTLAFFIHNSIESIMKCNKNQDKNARDLMTAFFLVALTYLIVGVTFFLSFPLPIKCLEDNLLNNLSSTDIFSFIGRIALFFQILTVFPLLMYVLRVQVMSTVFHSVYPGFWRVMIFHLLVLGICLTFSMVLPSIGTIIRFSGSLSALIYIFALPCACYILSLMRDPESTDIKNAQFDSDRCEVAVDRIPVPPHKVKPMFRWNNLTAKTWAIIFIHVVIILLGAGNFAAQFIISFLGDAQPQTISINQTTIISA